MGVAQVVQRMTSGCSSPGALRARSTWAVERRENRSGGRWSRSSTLTTTAVWGTRPGGTCSRAARWARSAATVAASRSTSRQRRADASQRRIPVAAEAGCRQIVTTVLSAGSLRVDSPSPAVLEMVRAWGRRLPMAPPLTVHVLGREAHRTWVPDEWTRAG